MPFPFALSFNGRISDGYTQLVVIQPQVKHPSKRKTKAMATIPAAYVPSLTVIASPMRTRAIPMAKMMNRRRRPTASMSHHY